MTIIMNQEPAAVFSDDTPKVGGLHSLPSVTVSLYQLSHILRLITIVT